MTKEARAGMIMPRSMKSILKKILRCRLGCISKGQKSFVNMVCACIHKCEDDNQLSVSAIGRQVEVSKMLVSHAKIKTYHQIALIVSGGKKGFEFIDTDQKRSKFNDEQLTKFEQRIEKYCQLVIENPLKNDMVWKKGRDGQVIYRTDKKPLKIQKKLLMSLYSELCLYMIDNYPGMVLNEDTVLYSESTLRRRMPNHIKKAGERYKQMCGYQTCIIFKDMYFCLQIWRKRFICNHQSIIDTMQRSCAKNNMQERLDVNKSTMMADETIILVRAWDAAAQIACPKIKVNLYGNEDAGKYFHKFGCVMGECNECPKWSDHISDMGMNCTNPMCYCVFGAFYKCILHGQTNIEYNKSNKAYCLACKFDNGATKSTIRNKYICMMKSEPMNEFIKQGGTYHTNIQTMLYHTFLVVMLGLTMLAKSVEEEVRSND